MGVLLDTLGSPHEEVRLVQHDDVRHPHVERNLAQPTAWRHSPVALDAEHAPDPLSGKQGLKSP